MTYRRLKTCRCLQSTALPASADLPKKERKKMQRECILASENARKGVWAPMKAGPRKSPGQKGRYSTPWNYDYSTRQAHGSGAAERQDAVRTVHTPDGSILFTENPKRCMYAEGR